ncbi:MAG: rod shape-determining protein [Deltaproteobacteria bacterium]|nr:rod shape-determining protein [Deltaproteobacteria bacterium]
MLSRLLGMFSKHLAMDLGTANTLIYTRASGIVLNEPSVVAVDVIKNKVLAVGREAKEYMGRTPRRIKAVRPMRDGVIADFEITKDMIAYFIRKVVQGLRIVKPSIVICVPTGITQVEKRAVVEAAQLAGAREVFLIEEPMAAAIGANLPIHEPLGNLVVDIGGGTTEVAVITMSAIAYAQSVRVAGDAMNHAIQRYLQDAFQLVIGENMAERVKILIGSAAPLPQALVAEVSGKDMVQGSPKMVRVSDSHIREALRETTNAILSAIFKALEKTPPELTADIARNGALLAGGGSLLKGLDQLITRETHLKVIVDSDPLTTVLRGTGRTLDDRKFFSRVYRN